MNVSQWLKGAAMAAAAALFAGAARADTLATWSLNRTLDGNSEYTNALSVGAITAGSGVSSLSLDGKGYSGQGWNSASRNDEAYFQFSVTAADDFQVELGELAMNFRSSKNGPAKAEVRWSLDGTNWTSAVTFNVPLDGNDTGHPFSTDFSDATIAAGKTATFRIYAWGASSKSGTFRIGNSYAMTLSGTVKNADQAGATLSGPTALYVGETGTYTLDVVLTDDMSDSFSLVAAPSDAVEITPSAPQTLEESGKLEFAVKALSPGEVTLSVEDDEGLGEHVDPIALTISEKRALKTATYTISGTGGVKTSGEPPAGSSTFYTQDGQSAGQLDVLQGLHLTLQGYEGAIFTGLSLNMKGDLNSDCNLSVDCGSSPSIYVPSLPASLPDGLPEDFADIQLAVPATVIDDFVAINVAALAGTLYVHSITVEYEPYAGEPRWMYEAGADGCATVTGVVPAEGELTMPETLGGMRVTAVGTNAFKGRTDLAGMALAAGVTNIGAGAFAGCTGLETVTLPAGLLEIGNGAFKGCQSLGAVEFPAGLEEIGVEAFSECLSLREALMPDSVAKVGGSAFLNATNLATVRFGAGVESVGAGALFCRTGGVLETVYLPATTAGAALLQNAWLQNGKPEGCRVLYYGTQTVTFDAAGGTCEVAEKGYAIGEVYGELPEAERGGFEFEGWRAADGTAVTTNSIVPAEEATRTLVARWRAVRGVIITEQPEGRRVAPGESVTFTVGVRNHAGVSIPLDASTSMELVFCPAGTFEMGSPDDELGREANETRHTVTLTHDFWLGKYEVKQKEYVIRMIHNHSEHTGDDNLPVEEVIHYKAQEFCGRMTAYERSAGRLPEGYLYALPTEAEWEYACRAGTTKALNSGEDLSNATACSEMDEVGWYKANGGGQTHLPGQKRPNAWGLYDMHGNVEEWCWDFYQSEYPAGAATNPPGPSLPNGDAVFVRRGGSWDQEAHLCRSAVRRGVESTHDDNQCGFRVALVKNRNVSVPLSARVSMELVWVGPGTFQMGSPMGELGRKDDETQHDVTLTEAFWLGQFEVTQAQWEEVMGDKPEAFDGSKHDTGDDLPIYYVSRDEALEFCAALTARERAAGRLAAGWKFSLPTEAQWEYACRAGTTKALNNDHDLTSTTECSSMDQVGWYKYNSGNKVHPTSGSREPNSLHDERNYPNYAQYDMHGNVREWVLDRYGAYPTGAVTDPTGPENGGVYILRGGSCTNEAEDCRSAARFQSRYGDAEDTSGLRVAIVRDHAVADAALEPYPGGKEPWCLTGGVAYQWYRDGEAIEGATGASLTIAGAAVSDEGRYTVTVTALGESATSAAAVLAVAVERETVDGEEWLYVGNGEGATVVGANPAAGDLTMPETLGGMAVTEVGAEAFQGCTNLTGMTIAGGVTNVGANAFAGCGSLETVRVPVEQKDAGLLDGAGLPEGCRVLYYGTQTVTFDAGEGTCEVAEKGYAIGEVYGELPEAERGGFEFEGWRAADGTAVTTNSIVPAEEATRTLVARWRAVRGVIITEQPEGRRVAPGDSVTFSVGVRNHAGVSIPLDASTSMELVFCPAGTFEMGSPDDELGRGGNETRHTVTLTHDFWLGKYEVKQKEFKSVMPGGDNPSGHTGDDNLPVEMVRQGNAENFCQRLRQNEQRAGRLPEGYLYTLPTEAEWEYACRAGTTQALNSGRDLTNATACSEMDEVGWYKANGGGQTHLPGQKRPNAWGLYDMHGNVEEWCWDWYRADYPAGAATNPAGPRLPNNNKDFVRRGGSWDQDASVCRSAARRCGAYGQEDSQCGFRVALVKNRSITVPLSADVSMEMAWVDAGTFRMGSPTGELGRKDDETQHDVTLTEKFWIGKFEVTQEQWIELTGGWPEAFDSSKHDRGDDLPVYYVSRDEALEFCAELTARERAAGRLAVGWKFSLPTEAQWEYACRAGTTRALNNGHDLTSTTECSSVDEVAWYKYNSGDKVHSTHSKAPNNIHCEPTIHNNFVQYNMHGNVREWVLDRYGDYPTGAVTDPTGPEDGDGYILRGGGCTDDAKDCRSATRIRSNGSADDTSGLRVAIVRDHAVADAALEPYVVKEPWCLTGGVAYQWYRDGEAIEGATGASLTIAGAAVSDAGSYTVTVTAAGESATSAEAVLEVAVERETVDGEEWLYVGNGEGATVVGANPAAGDLTMPETLGGMAVTEVGAEAFQGCTNLTGMTIAGGVTNVGANAFAGCGSLAAVWVPVEQKDAGLLDGAGLPEGCAVRYYGTQVVTFDAGEGTCAVATKGYEIGKAYGELPVAERGVYEFDGWWAEDGNGGWVPVAATNTVTEEATRTLVAQWSLGPVAYWDPVAGTNGVCTNGMAYAGQTRLTSGWWVVSGSITNAGRIVVDGDVHLLLMDGAELVAQKGVEVAVVEGVTNRLTVWAQSDGDGMGRLTATASYMDAGIGGNVGHPKAGAITINGGFVAASCVADGSYACGAGIGGGNGGSGGTVTVNGGVVTASCVAKGSYDAQGAGIGGGSIAPGGIVVVNGGTVTASCVPDGDSGHAKGAGIGGGYYGDGGGQYGHGDGVTINGGTVTATAGDGAEAIGHGLDSPRSGDLAFGAVRVTDPAGTLATNRMGACRALNSTVTLEVCCPHEYEGEKCKWCGMANPVEKVEVRTGAGSTNAVITFTLARDIAGEAPEGAAVSLVVTAFDTATGESAVADAAALAADDAARAGTAGEHTVTWNLADAFGESFVSTGVVFGVEYRYEDVARWCAIDLSGGTNAAVYPVSYLAEEPSGGFNADPWKTTNLVLRLVEAGTFTMGSPADELGHRSDTQHEVTLTRPFYIGVFETTQRQWELVTGGRPSYFVNADCYATRPVEQVSYVDIRGSSVGIYWPVTNSVDDSSFLGFLRDRTGLALDLPTEAQWEYACRAGTTNALNSGKDLASEDEDDNLGEVGRYRYNGGLDGDNQPNCSTNAGTAAVGSYDPNNWGLYDMHGNVFEWCLDWYGVYPDGAATDPVGSDSGHGHGRVHRGGCWYSSARNCRSAYREDRPPTTPGHKIGFRLALPVAGDVPVADCTAAGRASEPVEVRMLKPFAEGDIVVTGSTNVYDGTAHGIVVATNAIEGLALRYGIGASALDFGLSEPPGFTDVTNATVWVQATAPGYFPETNRATVAITPAALTIAAKDQEYVWNGQPQGEGDTTYATDEAIAAKVEAAGLKGEDRIGSVTLSGQATAVGVYSNRIEVTGARIANGTNDVTGNYAIGYAAGTLTIQEAWQTVTFNANGGTCGTATNRYKCMEPYGELPVATRALHTFDGWKTADGARVAATNIVSLDAELTLVADWLAGTTTNGVRWLCATNGDGTVTVTGAVPTAGDMAMPDALDGFPVTAVGTNAFENCTNLTGMAVADGVTNIGEWAFSECYGLTNVTFGTNVTAIGMYAFYTCTNLTEVAIPGGVTALEEGVFGGCVGLTNVTMGGAVTNIGVGAFYMCVALREVELPEGLAAIGSVAFGGSGLTDVRIPDATTDIAAEAFEASRVLTNVWLGTGIESVGAHAFFNCTNLAAIWVPVEKKEAGLLDGAMLPAGCEIRYYGTQTVTFDANGGTCSVATNGYVIGEPYGALPVATWEGYDFLGWFDEAGGGVEVTAADAVSEEAARTLTARWRVGGGYYTVAYNRNGGTGTMATQVIPRGTKAWLRYNAFRREGYTFMGWAETWNGAVVHADHAAVTDRAPAGGGITFYARWAKTKYTVAFDANGGTGRMAAQGMTYGTGAALRKNAFARNGWVFIGWARWKNGPVVYADGASVKNLRTDGKTTTLYAKWAKKTYTVAFDANGGKLPTNKRMKPQTFEYGKGKRLQTNVFIRSGSFFVGWATTKDGPVAYEDGQWVKNLRTDGGTLRLYAKWVKKAYTVTYDGNGGKGTMHTQLFIYGHSSKLTANKYKRSGWTFAGWGTSKGGPVVYADGELVKNLRTDGGDTKLYAQWKKNAAAAGRSRAVKSEKRKVKSEDGVVVTTSDGSDGSAAADGDEGTGWAPEGAEAGTWAWVVVSFGEAVEAGDVEVVGDGLEAARVLWSEDAETWEEEMPGMARYVWVAVPAGGGWEVREVRRRGAAQ